MRQRTFRKKHKLFFLAGIITMPLMVMSPYNWWLIATIIAVFLTIAIMTKNPKQKKREL